MEEHRRYDTPPEIQPLARDEIQRAEPKPLYRSTDNRMFLGVAGGLGEYFEVDPTLVRILFVAGTLLGGSAIVVYAVMALVMPSEAARGAHPREAARSTVDEAAAEIQKGVDWLAARARRMFGR